ncbi:MAG TPA: glycoside hydrolase domain-containing protein [Opitutaceae bacterium]|nr:glycoside hydrolase domain-containing protein [Opitutaceae bacterium]
MTFETTVSKPWRAAAAACLLLACGCPAATANVAGAAGTDDAGAAGSPSSLVDPFVGTDATDWTPREGFAARWKWIKAEVGNDHPGPCYPCGMLSACPDSGTYSSGYGLNMPSTTGRPKRRFQEYTATGFTHFQQSGAGAVGRYYNYVKFIPLAGDSARIGDRWVLRHEVAHPGYYSAELGDTGIKAEITVGKKCAVHRYTFPDVPDCRVAIDLSAGGLDAVIPGYAGPTTAAGEAISNTEAQGEIFCMGHPIYFYLVTDADGWVASSFSSGAFSAVKSILVTNDPQRRAPFGLMFSGQRPASGAVTVKIGFSFRSIEQARENLALTGHGNFDTVAAATREEWDRELGRVKIAGNTADAQKLFYTNLYHSLIKPADFTGEDETDAPLFLDICTMWDMYKTHLPLMMTLYPERGSALVNSFLHLAEVHGSLPAGAGIGDTRFGSATTSNQGRNFAHVTIADAFCKHVPGIDWREAERLMVRDFDVPAARSFIETGANDRPSLTVDYAYSALCTAEVAKGLGDQATYQEMMRLAGNWRNAYDPSTGILRPGRYYEGGRWNYSFRYQPDVAGQIALSGGDQRYCDLLDMFFRITEPPADLHAESWEALNNQPDMESPYLYVYAGRPDRTAKVVRACMKYQFNTSRGGLPGNDDCGGTSAWFVWSAMGIFPVAGQDIYLLGSPLFPRVEMEVGGKAFVIEAKNNSDTNIYVQSATLNGRPLDRAYLSYAELSSGATLVLTMGPAPSAWGRDNRPPTFR